MKNFLIATTLVFFAITATAVAHPNHTCHFHGTVQHCR